MKDLPNLAGARIADATIATELAIARIPQKTAYSKPDHEVPSMLTGALAGFTFTRAWTYWVVNGPLPLSLARVLYQHPEGRKHIRVAGHCGCPAPDDWCTLPYPALTDQEVELSVNRDGWDEYVKWAQPIDAAHKAKIAGLLASGEIGELVVTSYHIDSLLGLCLFAGTLSLFEALFAPPAPVRTAVAA